MFHIEVSSIKRTCIISILRSGGHLDGSKAIPSSVTQDTFLDCTPWPQIPIWKIKNKMNCELMLTYDTTALRQTGSRNLMGLKTLPTIWGTYMKLVTKYQISAINSCWEKCDEKCAYMFNVYKNQLSRQTGSRNLTGPKTLSTILRKMRRKISWTDRQR